MDAGVEVKLVVFTTARSANTGFFVTTTITSLIGWDRMLKYLLSCIIVHIYVEVLYICNVLEHKAA